MVPALQEEGAVQMGLKDTGAPGAAALGLKLATAAFRTKVPLPAHTAPGASAPPGGGARMEAVRSGGAGLPGSCLRREAQWVGTSDRNLGSPGQPEVLCPSLQLLF